MSNIVPVPLAALAIDSENPQPGDPVDFQVSGTLDRIEGDLAYVRAESINGQPLPAEDTSGEDMSEDEMRGMAEKADALPFGSP
jgi:hypothetical protein